MFSVDYIHKSQDVSNRNLTNSKTRRLLREAYAIPYSVSPCEFLCWALSEPLFEISMGFMRKKPVQSECHDNLNFCHTSC